jgi:hypothetical protein
MMLRLLLETVWKWHKQSTNDFRISVQRTNYKKLLAIRRARWGTIHTHAGENLRAGVSAAELRDPCDLVEASRKSETQRCTKNPCIPREKKDHKIFVEQRCC